MQIKENNDADKATKGESCEEAVDIYSWKLQMEF